MKQALVSDLSLPLSSVYLVPPLRHRPLPLGVGLFYGERGSSISCMLGVRVKGEQCHLPLEGERCVNS